MAKQQPLRHEDIDRFLRANTGVVIVNSRREVLAFERKKQKGAWQFPQGGIDPGEDPLDCAKRELEEETGLVAVADLRYLGEIPEWIGYELPEDWRSTKTGRGQVQRWFFFQVLDDEIQLDLSKVQDNEFRAWQWMTMQELLDIVIEFRKPVYRRIKDWLEEIL